MLAARSKAWVYDGLFAGLWLRFPSGYGGMSLGTVVCCQVDLSSSG